MQRAKIILDIVVPFARFLRRADTDPSSVSVRQILTFAVPQSFLFVWLTSFVPIVGTLAYTVILIPLAALVHIQELDIQTRKEKAATLLWYFVVITIGFGGFWGFVGHTFLADSVARSIGWATGSQFQIELAFYHLGFGVAGLMAVWVRDHLISGLIIAKSIFWYGAAYVHIKDAIVAHNFAVYNVGPPLIGDIVIPTLLLTLLYLSYKPDNSPADG